MILAVPDEDQEKKTPPKRVNCFLSCSRCNVVVPVQVYKDRAEDWPLHKCPADYRVHMFDTVTDDDPRKTPLG